MSGLSIALPAARRLRPPSENERRAVTLIAYMTIAFGGHVFDVVVDSMNRAHPIWIAITIGGAAYVTYAIRKPLRIIRHYLRTSDEPGAGTAGPYITRFEMAFWVSLAALKIISMTLGFAAGAR